MNFRLVYQGPLKAASQSDTRRLLKHEIRKEFGKQLSQLMFHRGDVLKAELEKNGPQGFPFILRGGFVFVAVVRENVNLVCDLDILFLRRDKPGSLIGGGGDLDNRIKVLFDALRVPSEDEIRGIAPPGKNDNKLIPCLVEDDKLITGFRITTDRLLEPASSPAEENHVHLIINVEIKATTLTPENMAYFSHF